ncbi:MAG: hypothetical protein EBS98_07545 [Chitinophagia bacterium]|nr:hypothetical protein [Chitinophagia bacterium]
MKKIVIGILVFVSASLKAQSPEDGLRLSWFAPNGTPRSNALGGAMGSLGGDLSAAHINPAGLGFYKSGELLVTSKYLNTQTDYKYRGTNTSTSDNTTTLGNLGIVLADGKKNRGYSSTAFSISFTQIADFNTRQRFKGVNNFSSYSEKFLEELYYDNAGMGAAENNYIFGSSLAFRTYLIDTTANAKGAVNGYQSLVPISSGVNQSFDALTTGSYDELAFGWGGNMEDKLYLGASLVLPMINYTKSLTYSEADATSNPDNYFGGFVLNEHFSSRGWGIGAKLGIIYKPESFLRLGFTLHTPQVISFRDQMSASMTTNTEKYAGIQSASSSELNNGYPGTREYTVSTPTKAIFSTSYFFASPSKPTQPLGFISADLEVVNYAGTRFYANSYDKATSDYYSLINDVVKVSYKNNINFKIGSELKLSSNWMVRGGAAYYGSPYKDETLKASRMVLSGGIGYRTNRNFIDFTIVSSSTKDALFPYRLNDKPNTYASLTANQLLFNIGYGIRF